MRAPRILERLPVRKVLRRLSDGARDLVYSGSLEFMIGHLEAKWHSGHDQLDDLFDRVPVRKDDVLADIGCGKGRVVAFLAARFKANKVIGVEIEATARFARRIFAHNPRIEIRHATLEEAFPAAATIFYLYPPSEGDLAGKLKTLIDERATRDTLIVAKGAMGDLAAFLADESWSVQHVPPPSGWLERFTSTHFVYNLDKRGPGYHYGLLLKKTVRSPRASG